MIASFFATLPIFAIIGAGWLLRASGIAQDEAAREMNRFVVYLALPALLFRIIGDTDPHLLWDTGFFLCFTGGSLIAMALGIGIARWTGAPFANAALDGLNAGYANTGFLGFPLMLATLGPWTQPMTLVASMVTICGLFALAMALVEAGLARDKPWTMVARGIGLAILKNPVVLAPALALAMAMRGWHLPAPAHHFIDLLGQAASPCALVSLGLFLANRHEGTASRDGGLTAIMVAVKLLFQPLAVFALCRAFGLSGPMTTCATLLAALPTGTGPFMLAELYAINRTRTARIILASTLGSIVTVPLLFHWLG
ncbi:AEC family transporter [Sphingobium sp.]|uniref:AEC family transporter n=1 Tax=Sphingobium sp. TaxID=1912891 RepID=UPI003B3A150A